MALTRSAGARKDTVRGTAPIEVRKAAASRWSTTGVVSGGTSPLVVGTAGFAYSVGAAGFVTSRGASDGVHEFTNDGALSIACPTAPGSGLSRIDIVYVVHPATGENGDTSSQPILGVASGAASSSSFAVPTIPTGALELARNTMSSTATTTASAGNTIAQTATVALLRVPASPAGTLTASIGAIAGTAAPDGTILKKITITGPYFSSTAGRWVVNYPVAFPNGLMSAQVSLLNGDSYGASLNFYGNPGLSSAVVQVMSLSTGAAVPNINPRISLVLEGW